MVVLTREAFEGIAHGSKWTWFVEGSEGIFDALSSVSAERASMKPAPNSPTMAAHALHMVYAMRNGNSNIGGPRPEGTWETSWEKEIVTDSEWEQIQADLKAEYLFFLNFIETNTDWSNSDMGTGSIGQLAHMAYHLGALRALIKL